MMRQMFGGISLSLAIHIFSVTQFKHEDCNPLVLNVADQTIVADTIAPQAALFPTQSFAPKARVVCTSQEIVQKLQDGFLSRAVDFGNLFFGCASNFDSPGLHRSSFRFDPRRRSNSWSVMVGSRRSKAAIPFR